LALALAMSADDGAGAAGAFGAAALAAGLALVAGVAVVAGLAGFAVAEPEAGVVVVGVV
jgi:glycerate kinase